MPLYKKKILPQKSILTNKSFQATITNSLKMPVIDDNNKLNDNKHKRIEDGKIFQQKTRLKKNISAEMHISLNKINEIENIYNVDLKKANEREKLNFGGLQKRNGAKDDIKKNGSIIDGVVQHNKKNAANKNDRILKQKNTIEQIEKRKKKEIVTSKKSEKIVRNIKGRKENIKAINNIQLSENKTPSQKINCINDEVIKPPQAKKSKGLNHNHEADGPSELEESVISLWSQEQIPSVEPPEHLSHRERLSWLQEQRNVGLYVCCDMCNKYRYLKDTLDPLELPEKWYCQMNPDEKHNNCSIPEVELSPWEEDDLIYNKYHAGSIVWARLDGYPWWPAMVDDDPDTEMYYWLEGYLSVPTYYHVVFFDSEKVSRAWLKPEALVKFKDNIQNPRFQTPQRNKYRTRINLAKKQADHALALNVPDRLKNYSFLARWPGPIHPPINIKEDKIVEKKRKRTKLVKDCKKESKIKTNTMKNQKVSQNSFKSLLNEISKEKPVQNLNRNYLSPELFDDDTLNNNIAKLRSNDLSFNELDMLF